MRVLVTGGAGYIGSHTVKELLSRNYEVVVFDNFTSGREELLCGGEVVRGDLRSRENIRQVLKNTSRKLFCILPLLFRWQNLMLIRPNIITITF